MRHTHVLYFTLARELDVSTGWLLTITSILLVLALTACGREGNAAGVNGGSVPIRTPHPTFTPTQVSQAQIQQQPVAPDQTPTVQSSVGAAVQLDQPPGPNDANSSQPFGAFAVVNAPLVNARTGPSVDNDIVATVERGQEFTIVGRNGEGTWWQVCCIDSQTAWIINDYVDTEGPVDAAPVTGGISAQVQIIESEPAPATVPGEFTFSLATQEQFPESSMVRIFLYVLDGNTALPGYSLQVSKDGAPLPVETKSFGGQPAFTWPFQDARQRYQNLKLEYTDVQAGGTWEVQLLNPSGNPDGPPAVFTLSPDSPERELYVRYERK